MAKIFRKFRIKKHKDVVVLLAVILISASIYILSLNGVKFGGLFSNFIANSLYNVYKITDYPINISRKFYKNYLKVLSVKRENEHLKARINKIEDKLNKFKFYRVENKKLKALLSLKNGMGKESIPATVEFHGIEGWFKSLYIDKGIKDGIKVGDGVISYSGVVGRVVEAGSRHSRIIPITNPRCVFSVIDANTGTMGIAQGLGNGFLKMRFVFNYKKIKQGDEILTSGLGGIFTAGIKVGRVSSVKRKGYKIFQRITIIPQKNLFNSNHVLVEK